MRILKNWRKNFSANEKSNKAWALVPGFIIWDVWKERKNRIFKNKIGSPQSIMTQTVRQLKETIGILLKNLPDNQPQD